MNLIRRLYGHFKAYHAPDQPIIQYSGMIGMAAFPLFYLLRFTKAEAPFNDIGLRLLAIALCAGLALRHRWPARLKPYFFAYTYFSLAYCMPFFFVFTSLVNGGGTVGVANTLMAVFFVVLLSDWRNSVALVLVGTAAATALYMAVVPDPQFPRDYVARLPVLVLVMIGGSVFKFAEKQAETAMIKRTYSALAGSIAHEMRNPLGQIKNNLERVQQSLPAPSTMAEGQTISAEQVDALYRHVAESEMAVRRGLQVIAMTLDEVSAKSFDTSAFSYLSAAEATAKAVQEYAFDSDAERAKVSVHVAQDFNFRGDETAYLFVLFNLIKNSLYYLALDPRAHLTITVGNDQVLVRDTGPGVTPEARAALFEPFGSAKSGGTGLGLAYCQRAMRAFGGEIECNSVVGEFTQFTLSFPPVSAEAEQTQRREALEKVRTALAGKRVLIVDDDAAQRMATRRKLEPFGVVMGEAANGQRALDALAISSYDIVLLDLQMPVLDGYAVAEKFRQGQAPVNRDIAIVAYTSDPADLARVKSNKAGMDGFIVKPCAQLPMGEALQIALEAAMTRTQPEATLVGCRILLADDSPHNRKAVVAYLKHVGVEVVEAGHGQAVLDALQGAGKWDAVLMDINMPGMNGLEAALAIRRGTSAARDVPIIALTAHSDTATIDASRSSGMNDFLTKPVEAAVLYEKLGRLIAGFALTRPPVSPVAASVQPVAESTTPMLDLKRLESYKRMGLLEDLMNDYLPEIARLALDLQRNVEARRLEETLDTLHSLLGMSGEAGAQALYHAVRRTYVPMIEARSWPQANAWADQITVLAAQADKALRSYIAAQTATQTG
ncbi:MAG: response regulator [Ramlibacter sp.]|nr:response regulator [Ramlibacter sp.]